jgi:mediator of RNA polymerase II transcription subunit 6
MAGEVEVTPHTCFVDPVWLQHCGGVRPENALEYFQRSPFFARGEGVEFALCPVRDPRCVGVVRRRRRSERVADNEAFFYILNGTIYQCPAIDELAQSRLRKCAHHLADAYAEMRALCRADERRGASS